MAQVTGFTAAKMQSIVDGSMASAAVVGNDLILTLHDGSTVNVGNVRGIQGIQGIPGPASIAIVADFASRPSGLGLADEGLALYQKDTNEFLIWKGAVWGGLTPDGIVAAIDPWHYIGNSGEPAFQHSWVNYTDAFGGEPTRFRQKSHDMGEVRGDVGGGNLGTVIATLPAACRPDHYTRGMASVYDGAVRRSGIVGIDTTGDMTVYSEGTGATNPLTEVSFDISFVLA